MAKSKRFARIGAGVLMASLAMPLLAVSESGGATKAHAASIPVINIGFDAQEGGALAAGGTAFVHGAEVAVNEVNRTGGVIVNGKRYNFNLDVCNDNSDQTQAAACVDQLVLDHHDKFMFGGLANFGPIVHGITEANDVLYFSTGSAVAALMPTSHWTINTVPSIGARSLMSAKAAKHLWPQAKNIAMLGDQSATTAAAFPAVEGALKREGFNIVGQEIAPLSVTDFSSLLTQLKGLHPDILWLYLSTTANTQEALMQNAQLGVATKVFDNSSSCAPTIEPSTPGVTFAANTNTGAIGVGKLEPQAVKTYEQRYYSFGNQPNPDPSITSALFIYDFFPFLKLAIQKAGTFTNTRAIDKALNSITYQGIDGTISLKDNQSSYGQVMCVMNNGNDAPYEFEEFPTPTGSPTAYSYSTAS